MKQIGLKPMGDVYKDFMAHHHHKPSDDLFLPIRCDMGAKFTRPNYAITRELADGPRPTCNRGDLFAAKVARPSGRKILARPKCPARTL